VGIVLGTNQYGKAENRVVRITRQTERHEIRDLSVSTSLRGDFSAAHSDGDQADVLPTDTQKNTVFAFAKSHGISSPEDFGRALGKRFLTAADTCVEAQIRLEEYAWDRVSIPGTGEGHDHAFVRRGTETRTAVVTSTRESVHVLSGLTDLTLLKSTGSEFKGFLKDEYTTLAETDDRIMATSLTARWRTTDSGAVDDWDAAYLDIRSILLATFAQTYSRALQETLFLMGEAVLKAHPQVAEVRFSAPNKHHFLSDLSPFGLDNPGEVFYAADRPYGLIEAQVKRDDVDDDPAAWAGVPGFL
jgi:urate oxidase